MTATTRDKIKAALDRRFGDAPEVPNDLRGEEPLLQMAAHRTHRAFADKPVAPGLLRFLAAVALSAPSKSDLQQRDIVLVEDPATRKKLDALIPGMDWLPAAPALMVICGNNRRQRQFHQWRNQPYPNDHLDPFFNAATDAAIVLGWLINAAEAAGLGCCPLSVIRNNAQQVSELLGLPDHVFPYVGLALGWPAREGWICPRLPIATTLHVDRFNDGKVREQVEAYDQRRASLQPPMKQRNTARFGEAAFYGWSEDKFRQYAEPERADFGAYVRRRGFDLK